MKEYYKSLGDFFKSLMLFCATISTGLIAYIYTSSDYNMLVLLACYVCFMCAIICGFASYECISKIKDNERS